MERLPRHDDKPRGMSASTVRIWGYICLAMGIVGKGVIQNGILGLGSVTSQELMDILGQSGEMMALATASIVMQGLEACAVPIFAYLLVEGFQKTSNYKNYLVHMILVAVLSEIPYNLAFGGQILVTNSRNPAIAMVICLLMLYFYRYCSARTARNTAIKTVVTISAILWSGMLNIEHGVFLVLMTAVFWLMRGKPNFRLLAGCGVSAVAMLISPFNITAPFGCMLLYLYNGEKGDSNRVINLLCYPLMLLAAGVASLYL